jgi:putative endopeptidase
MGIVQYQIKFVSDGTRCRGVIVGDSESAEWKKRRVLSAVNIYIYCCFGVFIKKYLSFEFSIYFLMNLKRHNMHFVKALFLISACASAFVRCTATDPASNDPLVVNRDLSVDPADDFFQYANGAWFRKNPIPADRSDNGVWVVTGDTLDAQVRQICEKAALDKNSRTGSDQQKIGDFYASGMDTFSIEKEGINSLKMEFNKVDAVSDLPGLLTEMAHLHTLGLAAGFDFYVDQDEKNSAECALYFSQGGLGLYEKEYYFSSDAESKEIRREYLIHLERMLKMCGAGAQSARKEAKAILRLETDLARGCRSLEDLRNPEANYNKMSMAQFSALSPAISWSKMLLSLGIRNPEAVIVGQPEFFVSLNSMLTRHAIQDWKAYMKWCLIFGFSDYLSKRFGDQNFYFYDKVLDGVELQKPRWKSVVNTTNNALGDLIGKVYVAEYIPAGSKEKLLEIGKNIRSVFASHIQNLDWMSQETKERALKKLNGIVMKMAFPDKWRDMSQLKISRNSYCQNKMNINQWEYQEMIRKYGKPVDRTEWGMSPQTDNAYYNPSNNEIVLPACNIFIPGFDRQMPDDAVLYGKIGTLIGHEITHGFDDEGCQFDERGNLKNWWTFEDLKKFKAKTKRIVAQFDAYRVLGNKHLNGSATQGENIADLGGLVMGFEAFKKTKQYQSNKKINGLYPDQRFFLGYAYAWMQTNNEKALSNQLKTDVHAPAKFRVNGPLSNMPEFYKAFQVKKGDRMFRSAAERVVIW